MNGTVAVLGPGAVGGSLAVRLATNGVPVVCVAHAEAAGLIALAGLVVESPEGTLSARLEVVEQLAKPVSILLVTVKAPALEDAIAARRPGGRRRRSRDPAPERARAHGACCASASASVCSPGASPTSRRTGPAVSRSSKAPERPS